MLSRILLLAAVGATLAACGKQGELQRPPPLFGEARVVTPEDRARGAPDETSTQENQAEDARSAVPSPNEDVRPTTPGVTPAPAAPVNIPPKAS
jgi:predicted small lipoprotein YifL